MVRQTSAPAMTEEAERTIYRPSPLSELRAARAADPTLFAADPVASANVLDPRDPAPSARAPYPRDDDLPDPGIVRTPRNAIVEAATPLLALASAVRSRRVDLPLPELHRRAVAAAAVYDQALGALQLDAERQRRARYGVYATVDDIAQTLPGRASDGAEWARRSMVVRGFGENIGGDRFWMLLSDMLQLPNGNVDLIELYHACLAAGFRGRHRVGGDGDERLRRAMADAYAALPHVRALSDMEIVSEWRGRPTPRDRAGPWSSLPLVGSVLAALLIVAALLFRLVLAQTGQPALSAMAAINPSTPLRLSRRAAAATPPASAQQDRLARFLAPEISRHLVALEQDATSVRVRTTVGQLFRSGSDSLEPGRQALFERIARAIAAEKGGVHVEGHADGDPVRSLAFPDNQALSEARARRVAEIFRDLLPDPARVSSEGFGATRPVAAEDDAAGKALNRRVEIVVPRAE